MTSDVIYRWWRVKAKALGIEWS